MFKNWPRLIDWFDRPRDHSSFVAPPPVRVTRERARQARAYLQQHSGIDFEEFRSGTEVEALLHEPLGETSECFSVDDIAKLSRSHMLEPFESLDEYLIARSVRHTQECDACFDNIELFQETERRSIGCALAQGVENLPAPVWIGPIGRVVMAGAEDPILGLSVTTRRDHVPSVGGPNSLKVRLGYPFDTEETLLRPVEMTVKPRAAVSRSSWGRAIPVDRTWTEDVAAGHLVNGYYHTDQLAKLDQIRHHMCGFVGVSQQVGGKEIHSTRIVRLERSNEAQPYCS